MAERPAACASCGKRLSKKAWYYRHQQFFCNKRCWDEFQEKAAAESTKAKEAAAAAPAAAPAST